MEISKKTNKKAKKISTQRNLGYRIFNNRIEKNWNPETWEDEYTEQES